MNSRKLVKDKRRTEADYWSVVCPLHRKKFVFYRKIRWQILRHPHVWPWNGRTSAEKLTTKLQRIHRVSPL
jgi:hypothetical protein